jgi:hypothetical protein
MKVVSTWAEMTSSPGVVNYEDLIKVPNLYGEKAGHLLLYFFGVETKDIHLVQSGENNYVTFNQIYANQGVRNNGNDDIYVKHYIFLEQHRISHDDGLRFFISLESLRDLFRLWRGLYDGTNQDTSIFDRIDAVIKELYVKRRLAQIQVMQNGLGNFQVGSEDYLGMHIAELAGLRDDRPGSRLAGGRRDQTIGGGNIFD